MYYFTADEHYGHKNIIKYCNRPFKTVEEMDATIIDNHNKVVTDRDIVVHAGDFTLNCNIDVINKRYLEKLNGEHIFVRGSHDYWMNKSDKHYHEIWEKKIEGQWVVVCHYAMRRWARSHYGAWNLHGHSHGELKPEGKQYDIGVDNNNFYPISFNDVAEIMETKTENTVNHIRR